MSSQDKIVLSGQKFLYKLLHYIQLIHMSRYSTISVPVELHDELRKMVKEKPRLGYTSVAEFCKEAIRLHVSHIRMERKEAVLQQINLDDLVKKIDLLSSTTGGIYRIIFEELQDSAFFIAPNGRIVNCNTQMVDPVSYTHLTLPTKA